MRINAPKAVISRVSGNIVKILVKENDPVAEGQLLAWMESTADHRQILNLADKLDAIRNGHSEGKGMNIMTLRRVREELLCQPGNLLVRGVW